MVVNSGSVSNTGEIEVKGGTLDLESVTVTNTGGTVQVDSGATLDLESAIIIGGTLSGLGTIAAVSGDNTLNGVSIAVDTKVTANANATLDLTGTIANNGEIDAVVGGTIDLENVTINGGTLGGAGTIATQGSGSQSTLNGVTIANGATVKITDNTALDLKGAITNSGTIALNSSGDTTQLKISGSVSLNGASGHVTLTDNTHNSIVSDGLAATLTNFNTISGAGTIGDTHLTLVNNGIIDATGTHTLTIDTGINISTSAGLVGNLAVTNNAGGILEASAGSKLQIDDAVINNGAIKALAAVGSAIATVDITGNVTGTGSIEIFNKAVLEIGGSVSSGQTVTFEAPNGHGELILDDSHHFQGLIVGLVESSPEGAENYIDLKDFKYVQGHMSAKAEYHSNSNTTTVTFSDGGSSTPVTIQLSGNVSGANFEFTHDATGGTLVDDPLATSGTVTIDSGKTLYVAAASAATFSFANGNGNTGELVLADSKDFTGQIVGFAGDGTIANSDLVDLADVNFADVAMDKTTYVDNGNGTGTLTLYNAIGQALDSLTFAGNYQLANFTIESDGSGHTLIVDPPISTASKTAETTLTTGGHAVTFDNGAHKLSNTDQTVNNSNTIASNTGADKQAIEATLGSGFHNNGTVAFDGSAPTHLYGSNPTVGAHLAPSEIFVVNGGAGAATLIGESNGNNAITGGAGDNLLTGGGADDAFVFKAITDSQPGASHVAAIADFTPAANHIDFATISGLNDSDHAATFSFPVAIFENSTLTDVNATSDHAITGTLDSGFHNNGTVAFDGSAPTHLYGSNPAVGAHLAPSEIFVVNGGAGAATLIGESNGNNAIIGGAGDNLLTGGGANDAFVFKAITDSQPGTSHFGAITDFMPAANHIDFAAINGLNSAGHVVNLNSFDATPASVAAHNNDYLMSGDSAVIYSNASGMLDTLVNVDTGIHPNNVTNVHSTDFILHA